MLLTCQCPVCEASIRTELDPADPRWSCAACGRKQSAVSGSWSGGQPTNCCSCGTSDLWRQKDFPQRIGILMVALGAISSSIAWGYHRPVLALAILGAFAVVDMVLYWIMPDVLVCYRCGARHRVTSSGGEFGPYNHELGERYRQERLRVDQGAV